MRPSLLLILVAASALSCSPANVAGSFTIALTNRQNGCGFSNWTEGAMTQSVPFTVTQNGGNVTGVVQGVTGAYLDLVLGAHTFTGTVSGDLMSLTLYGTRSATMGNCTYTVNATASASVLGDALSGNIQYKAATNNNPDCSTIAGCTSQQDFNGTRPPQ